MGMMCRLGDGLAGPKGHIVPNGAHSVDAPVGELVSEGWRAQVEGRVQFARAVVVEHWAARYPSASIYQTVLPAPFSRPLAASAQLMPRVRLSHVHTRMRTWRRLRCGQKSTPRWTHSACEGTAQQRVVSCSCKSWPQSCWFVCSVLVYLHRDFSTETSGGNSLPGLSFSPWKWIVIIAAQNKVVQYEINILFPPSCYLFPLNPEFRKISVSTVFVRPDRTV